NSCHHISPTSRCTLLQLFSYPAPPPTEISTLSLHDALPIWARSSTAGSRTAAAPRPRLRACSSPAYRPASRRGRTSATHARCTRSAEHTSELQSQSNHVCRLLLEKKKKQQDQIVLHRQNSTT